MSGDHHSKFVGPNKIDRKLLEKELGYPSKKMRVALKQEQMRASTTGAVDYQPSSPSGPSAPERVLSPNQNRSGFDPHLKDNALRIVVGIENSSLSMQRKKDLMVLFDEIRIELQKPQSSREKILSMLKRGLDYDLKIAAEIIKFVGQFEDARMGQ